MKIFKEDINNFVLPEWIEYLKAHSYKILNQQINSVKFKTPMGFEIVLTDTGEGIEFYNETGHDEPYEYDYRTTPEEFREDMLNMGFDIEDGEL